MSGSPAEVKREMKIGLHPLGRMPNFVVIMWRRGFLSAKQAMNWREWSDPNPIEVVEFETTVTAEFEKTGISAE